MIKITKVFKDTWLYLVTQGFYISVWSGKLLQWLSEHVIGIVVAALSKIENFEMSATSSYCNGIIGNSVCLMEHITKQ